MRPMKPLISRRFAGFGYLLMLSIWLTDGSTPDWVILNPKIFTSFFPTSNFFGLKIIYNFINYMFGQKTLEFN